MGLKKKKEWSPNKYIFGALRKIWRWSAERRAVLYEAQIGERFKCAHCSSLFSRQNIAVDHINPVVDPKRGFVGWDEYIKRLFCSRVGLQVVCKPCHKQKSNSENKLRKEYKRKAA